MLATQKTWSSLVIALVVVAACHHAPPEAAPAPVQASAPKRTAELASGDSSRRATALADSLRLAREAAARDAASARAVLAQSIYFDFDRATIRDDQQSALEAKVPVLAGNSAFHIRVEGNTDERGSTEYNIALGMRRAAEAKRFLTDRGIAAARIETVSYGEERARCTTHEESCWQQNRRDDFNITAGGNGRP